MTKKQKAQIKEARETIQLAHDAVLDICNAFEHKYQSTRWYQFKQRWMYLRELESAHENHHRAHKIMALDDKVIMDMLPAISGMKLMFTRLDEMEETKKALREAMMVNV